MDKNRIKLLLCVAALLAVCLCGCGKNKVSGNNNYPANEISEIKIDTDTWKLSILASSDEKVHISFDGSVSDKANQPTATLQDGFLLVAQKSSDEKLQSQIALGKKGQITIYLPSSYDGSLEINNEMGDIEADSISATDFQLVNNAGYVTLSHLTADNLKVSSGSGDITVNDSNINNVAIVTSSGYVQLSNTTFNDTEVVTKSGEVNMAQINIDTDISIQTGSGDINLKYQATPDNLDFSVTSGSIDITTRFNGATYNTETTSSRQGIIGEGQHKLQVNSDNGTVVIK